MQKLRMGQWLVLCATVGCGVATPNKPAPSVSVTYEDAPQAFDAYNEGRYVEAATLFRSNPRAGTTMRLLAAQALLDTATTPDEAETVYQQARVELLEANQDAADHAIMGYIALRTNHLDEAAARNERSLELFPFGDHAGAALNNLGQVYYLREQFQTAREKTTLASGQTCGHGHEIAETNLAEFDALEGNLDAAEQRLGAMPGSSAALFELARIHDATGRHESALALERAALLRDARGTLRRNMTFVWPELRLQSDALQAEAQGNRTLATETWSALQTMECGGLRWSALTGAAGEHLRRLGAAVPACAQLPVVEIEPQVVMAVAMPSVVAKPVVPATTVSLSGHLNYKALGLQLLLAGQLEDAMKQFQLALKEDPQDAGAHEGMGLVHYMQANLPEARGELETSLRLANEPETVSVLLASLADIDALSGDTASAELKLTNALKASSEIAAPYYELAILYDVTGRPDAALDMERRALEIDVDGNERGGAVFMWPELRIHFDGLAAEAMGDDDGAIAQWTALRALDDSGALHWTALRGRALAHLNGLLFLAEN